MGKFKKIFRRLPDPRADNARHDLVEVLVIALAALLCGADSCSDMAEFGQAKEGLLRLLLRLEHGIPSHDTFSRVFRLLNPGTFEKRIASLHGGLCQGQWAQTYRGGGSRRQGLARSLRTRWKGHAAATGQRLCGGCQHGFGPAKSGWSQRDGRSFGSTGASVAGRLHGYRRRAALPPCLCGGGARARRRLCSGDQSQPRALVHGGYATVCAIGQAQHRRTDRAFEPRSAAKRGARPSCATPAWLLSTASQAPRRWAGSLRAGVSEVSGPMPRWCATISCPNTSPPRGCCTSPAVIGASRSGFIGCSTSISRRKPTAPERTMLPRTSLSCAGSRSTCSDPIATPRRYGAKSSAQAGTTPSSSP